VSGQGLLPQHVVTVEKIIAGGQGLARTEAGQALMSGFVLPGERVQLRELRQKSGYIEAELAALLEPSPERTAPRCPFYGQCGGCDLQHSSYAGQLRIKQAVVAETMQRAHVPLSAVEIAEVLASPQQWAYRHRLRLKISSDGRLGFFRKRSNDFVAIDSCPAAADEINTALAELAARRCLGKICPELELHCSPADRNITLVLPLKGRQRLPAAVVQELAACVSIDQIGCANTQGFQHRYSRSGTAEPLTQQIALSDQRCTLSWSGGCFSQVNPAQNEQLIQLVLQSAGNLQGKSVVDLYCGMGNFSLPLALAGAAVFGIEGNPESVRWAKRNAEAAGTTARFQAADVHASLQQMLKEQQQADIILLDPPRAGIGKSATLLPELRPEKIIYISCDPVTLARDLAVLCNKGFHLTALQPLDMFPQISHIETVAVLENMRCK
jgi:23S rRNA (uracil1939-C5)-methyltransferase